MFDAPLAQNPKETRRRRVGLSLLFPRKILLNRRGGLNTSDSFWDSCSVLVFPWFAMPDGAVVEDIAGDNATYQCACF